MRTIQEFIRAAGEAIDKDPKGLPFPSRTGRVVLAWLHARLAEEVNRLEEEAEAAAMEPFTGARHVLMWESASYRPGDWYADCHEGQWRGRFLARREGVRSTRHFKLYHNGVPLPQRMPLKTADDAKAHAVLLVVRSMRAEAAAVAKAAAAKEDGAAAIVDAPAPSAPGIVPDNGAGAGA